MEEARKEGETSMQEMTAKMEELANMQLAIQENEEKSFTINSLIY